LLVSGRLADARRVAEQAQRRHPDDPQVLTLLGRIYLAWPVVGRFRADSLLTRAGRLDPGNPEPFYWLGQVGLKLGGDDGEEIARRGLTRVLAIEPDYRDAWTLWLRLYRGDGERLAAVHALARHAGAFAADQRRAMLLIELGRRDEAMALLGSLAAARASDAVTHALLARTFFEQGRDTEGTSEYQRALRAAADDTAQVLWRQVRSIASAQEREAWAATPPERREAFLRLFWARRNPDLRAQTNARLGEHFRRMAQAERFFRLLHPNAMYFRSPRWRALAGGVGIAPGTQSAREEAAADPCSARLQGVRDAPITAGGQGPRPEPDSTSTTANLEDALDDRGRVWVRQGPPDMRIAQERLGYEVWCYNRPEGVYRVTFMRRTSGGWGGGGDMVVTPVLAGEAETAGLLLATDRPSLGSELTFSFWTAAFRSAADADLTELYLFPDSLAAIAVLLDTNGVEIVRDTASGRALRVAARPGRYALLLDGARAGRTGRYRGGTTLPDLTGEDLAVSSLLVSSGEVPPQRDSLAARAPAGLRLSAARPMRFYAEIYGLGRLGGIAHYEARYHFERIDGGFLSIQGHRERVSSITFEREQPFEPRTIETLLVDPGRLPRGRYRVVLEVVDLQRGSSAASAAMEFQLR
jgi:tetratricopeptide (TPR) repeat protein